MAIPNEVIKQPSLDELLAQSERELRVVDGEDKEKSLEEVKTDSSIQDVQTQTALAIERDILAAEIDGTRKLENGLWIGAHIVCLPFFYDEYTIRARVSPPMQKQYDQAIITTCGRFSAMGKTGVSLVSPIAHYIRNYADFSKQERAELEEELLERVFQWLKGEVSLDSQPQHQTSHSLQVIMDDIENAERIFEQGADTSPYMEGEVHFAAIQAIRHTDFLPPLVKYKLLGDLKSLNREQIFDIGTFLLWEIRKSSAHHNKLLYYMLRIFKRLSDTLMQRLHS